MAINKVARAPRAVGHALRVRRASNASAGHGLGGESFLVAGGAAFLASASAVAVTHPIDTIKTLRQGGKREKVGVAGLYKGVWSNVMKEAPNAAIYLATYEVFKRWLVMLTPLKMYPLIAMCVAGMLGDAVGSVVRVPAEIVNKRLQLGINDSAEGAIREAFLEKGGLEGTLAAWEAVLWRDVPYGGLQIAGYEWLRMIMAGWGLGGVMLSIVAGGVAGCIAAVLTTPMDVLVTKMSIMRPQCFLETRKYMRVGATGGRILKEEGMKGFWVGAGERGLFYMPMIALFFAGYEAFKSIIVKMTVSWGTMAGGFGLSGIVWQLVIVGLWQRLFSKVRKKEQWVGKKA